MNKKVIIAIVIIVIGVVLFILLRKKKFKKGSPYGHEMDLGASSPTPGAKTSGSSIPSSTSTITLTADQIHNKIVKEQFMAVTKYNQIADTVAKNLNSNNDVNVLKYTYRNRFKKTLKEDLKPHTEFVMLVNSKLKAKGISSKI